MLATEQPKALAEEPRRQETVLVVEDRAAADSPRFGVDHVVDKIHSAEMFVIGLIGETHCDGILHVAG